jgi:hypothetical protein
MRTFRTSLVAALAGIACVGLVGCGSDSSATPEVPSTPQPAPDTTPVPTPAPRPTPTPQPTPAPTDNGGGGMDAGAPSFTSFSVSSPVECQSGSATVEMSYETVNVVSIEIKIGDGRFEGTAGYGPNESSVVASIPCSGAETSSIQLRGCTENATCAESSTESVEITG